MLMISLISSFIIYTKLYYILLKNKKICEESLYNVNIYKEFRNREICND